MYDCVRTDITKVDRDTRNINIPFSAFDKGLLKNKDSFCRSRVELVDAYALAADSEPSISRGC